MNIQGENRVSLRGACLSGRQAKRRSNDGNFTLGFTLMELLIVVVLLAVLISAVSFGFLTVLKTWGSQDTLMEVQEDVHQGVEKILRNLRLAKALSAANDSIRYTVYENGADSNYIFYLYNASDSWPNSFNQSVYQLKRVSLSGGINGTFTYGDGTIYIKQVKPPAASDLSLSNNVITIDLTVSKYNENFHLLEKLRPRNL